MFDESALRTLTESEYRVTAASDRTGYKLEGPALANPVGTLPSEAGCPGSIQIPGDGLPIALMADAPTVGGYPKIAVVAEADLPLIAQRSPGEPIRFELITIEQSQRLLKRRASDLHTISQLASPLCAIGGGEAAACSLAFSGLSPVSRARASSPAASSLTRIEPRAQTTKARASLSLREHAAYEDALTLLPTESVTAAARIAAIPR